ncbi:MAG TPA: DUF4810 domain-containing protein [Candidatus Binatia bacterium]
MEPGQGRVIDVRILGLWLALAALSALGACARPALYSWGRYENLIYEMYMKPGQADPGTQVAKLTEDIEKAKAGDKPVPPGVHAHLGYLYYQQGNVAGARQELQIEKTLFPESAAFVDGVLQRLDQRTSQQ